MKLNKELFYEIESQLRLAGLDSDEKSFDEIKQNLSNPRRLDDIEFGTACVYVILAGGFSQKTAKKIHQNIMSRLYSNQCVFDNLFEIFHNKNKINAIVNIWENKQKYCDNYYLLKSLDDKLNYLSKLPHIGKITANHLARNLGEDIVKYDIWIQRLGIEFIAQTDIKNADELKSKIDNKKLHPDVMVACDKMFDYLNDATNLPRGYIDVVLWKAAQNKLIKI